MFAVFTILLFFLFFVISWTFNMIPVKKKKKIKKMVTSNVIFIYYLHYTSSISAKYFRWNILRLIVPTYMPLLFCLILIVNKPVDNEVKNVLHPPGGALTH